jgi:hypothetical protein
MIAKPMLLAIALAAAAGAAQAQVIVYAGDRAIAAAQAQAKSASFICEKELQAKSTAPACARYHAAVLKSMLLDRKRQAWCNSQFASEASNIRVPDSCLGQKSPDLRIDAVEGLERKVSPATWKAFDKQMENLP